jgi:hypothetical protein
MLTSFINLKLTLLLFTKTTKVRRFALLSAYCRLAAADKMNNLDAVTVVKICLLPGAARNKLAIYFYGDSLRRQR